MKNTRLNQAVTKQTATETNRMFRAASVKGFMCRFSGARGNL